MTEFPSDLIPLPTAPYPERPVSEPLVPEECRTALWLVRGNITEAAKLLKVTSLRLRQFVQKSPYLLSEMQEAKDQIVDIAESVVYDALMDEDDKGRKDTMARFVLGSQGKARGWGSASSAGGVNIKNGHGGTIIVQWADGQAFGDSEQNSSPETIDISPNQGEAA
jgi:hypothetical protein